MTLGCICGEISLELDEKPDFIHECNCSLCSKTGARWGYFEPAQVTVSGATSSYRRADKSIAAAEIHFCTSCGATTHFVLTEAVIAEHGNSMMGVNMWLADPSELEGIELRYPDGRGWSGVGEFGYVRKGRVL